MSIAVVIFPCMARLTRDERRQETREQLLAAAERVFAARGYHGASVAEIADAAGYTTGALYSNFAGKEELFLALLDRRQADQSEALAASGVRNTAAGAGIADVAAPVDPDAWTWGLLALEFYLYAMREPRLRPELASRYRAMRTELGKALMPSGRSVAGWTPSDLATATMALSTGLGIQASLDPDAIPMDLFARAIDRLTPSTPGDPVAPPREASTGGGVSRASSGRRAPP
jgi:AcrR family transcriptional regulator